MNNYRITLKHNSHFNEEQFHDTLNKFCVDLCEDVDHNHWDVDQDEDFFIVDFKFYKSKKTIERHLNNNNIQFFE